jgi:putative restriction endonuclease
LVEPFFWPEELWIAEPPGWHQNIQRGRTYDLREGDGLRIWEMVVERLQAVGTGAASHGHQPPIPAELPGGYSDPLLRPHRLGQGTFKALVTDAYGRRCAITKEKALPALDAAHIRPFSEVREHLLSNGILLRSDIHRLFDAGYITITPEYRVEASHRMKDDFDDGDNYLALRGERVSVPESESARPDPATLLWHNEAVYRG